ncbi:cytochrome d ubiquinol oxidase subunit II [Acidocella aromatica]|uniref:Cytochrome d ubiquinol oxidase subunit II n=1 Tax=Acidocella aromatica TaxID=1303579 RepID=A0A840VHL8_9PROT|nr:cytochrome d ubiquinol oxidase subunit II [Acidocella aromatica]MBB5372685.1 cytochrome d ubiquinol oxidase subunit II [Acidocella aromatica]
MELYVVLKVIWAVLLGVLFCGLAVMVGMDMGVGTLLNFVGKNDKERRVALNIIGPHWDGNQVWFILGGGAIFAAFPTLYATSFSVFYVVMILLLFSMIMRPVAFEYRSKAAGSWRGIWDIGFLISGAVPMIVYGAAFGNVMEGVGYHYSWTGQYFQDESFLSYLLNPFAVMCGVLALSMSIAQGGTMLMLRGEEPIYGRARKAALGGSIVAIILFAVGGLWVSHLNGFAFTAPVDPNMPATPLTGQTVAVQAGAWMNNYHTYPLLWALPILGFVGMLGNLLMNAAGKPVVAWWSGALAWIGVIFTTGASMFPFLMPSSTNPNQSLTVWNATGSAYNLGWMLFFALVFTPAIIAYTSWCYYVMRGKVKLSSITDDSHSY